MHRSRKGLPLMRRIMLGAGDRLSFPGRGFLSHEDRRAQEPSTRFCREGVPSCDHEAAHLTIGLRGTALSEQILCLQRALWQDGQGAAQAGHRRLNIYAAAQSELRRRAHDAGLIGQECPRDNADVAALPLHSLGEDLTVLQGHDGRIDRDIAARSGRPAVD